MLDPVLDRKSPDVAAFANQIDYGPMIFATLNLIDCQFVNFTAAKPASWQARWNRPIVLTPESIDIRQLPGQSSFLSRI